MRVESSLVRSVSTDNLQMSPYSSDDGSYFTIKPSRLIGEFTFLAFVQSQLNRVDLSFLLCDMALKKLLVDLFEMYVAVWVPNCMRICIGCMAFAHVCAHLCMTLRNVSGFAYVYCFCALSGLCICIRLVHSFYDFCKLSGLCIRICLLCSQRIVSTHMYFAL